MKKKYKDKRIRFIDDLYDYNRLSILRHLAKIYFHGHSVGGTNPSLLEAMASRAKIAAHGNEFNQSVLKGNALFFHNSNDIQEIILKAEQRFNSKWIDKNVELIKKEYNWERVAESYIKVFKSLIK
ncbi:hypothetical protein ES703_96829 [subsurface metagenome]